MAGNKGPRGTLRAARRGDGEKEGGGPTGTGLAGIGWAPGRAGLGILLSVIGILVE